MSYCVILDCRLFREKSLKDFSKLELKAGNKKVSKAKKLKPKRVVIHKGYQVLIKDSARRTSSTLSHFFLLILQTEEQPKTYDFALITLAEEIKVGKDLMPICLPSDGVKDMGQKVMTAGWGFTRVAGSCRTDGRGPKAFKECARSCRKTDVPNKSSCKKALHKVDKS